MRCNTLRPRQNGRHFADDVFKWIFLNENIWIPIEISLMFVPQGPINNIPALFQIMAWRRPGDKPLSGPMMVRLPTHICVTRPQWVYCAHWKDSQHLTNERQILHRTFSLCLSKITEYMHRKHHIKQYFRTLYQRNFNMVHYTIRAVVTHYIFTKLN